MNIPIIVYEGGESTRLDRFAIEKGIQGIINVLTYYNIIEKENVIESENAIKINKTSWIRARDSGIFRYYKKSGSNVEQKEILGAVKDVLGESSKNIISNRKAYIIGHNNAPVVNMGDALFNLGWYEDV